MKKLILLGVVIFFDANIVAMAHIQRLGKSLASYVNRPSNLRPVNNQGAFLGKPVDLRGPKTRWWDRFQQDMYGESYQFTPKQYACDLKATRDTRQEALFFTYFGIMYSLLAAFAGFARWAHVENEYKKKYPDESVREQKLLQEVLTPDIESAIEQSQI